MSVVTQPPSEQQNEAVVDFIRLHVEMWQFDVDAFYYTF